KCTIAGEHNDRLIGMCQLGGDPEGDTNAHATERARLEDLTRPVRPCGSSCEHQDFVPVDAENRVIADDVYNRPDKLVWLDILACRLWLNVDRFLADVMLSPQSLQPGSEVRRLIQAEPGFAELVEYVACIAGDANVGRAVTMKLHRIGVDF